MVIEFYENICDFISHVKLMFKIKDGQIALTR
jgi:hypothetical protein